MSASTRSRSLRLVVAVCLLSGLLVVHVSTRYLIGTLFGFVTYRELAPVSPFVVLISYSILLAGVAVRAIVRRGFVGLVPAAGLLLLAVEPVVSSIVWGDGCEVRGPARSALVPEVTVSAGRIVLHSWSGACSVSLTPAIVGIGLVLVGGGLRATGLPEPALARWLAFLKRHWPLESE